MGKSLELEFLTDFDKEAIDIGISRGCKSIYTSFTSSHKHVLSLKERIPQDIKIISKIETAKGLADIRKIAEVVQRASTPVHTT